MSLVLGIAEQVANAISAMALFEAATVEHGLAVAVDRPEVTTLHVAVVPGEASAEHIDRGSHIWTVPLQVAVRRSIDGSSEAEIMWAVEYIIGEFVGLAFSVDGTQMIAKLAEIGQYADRDLLHRNRVMESVFVLEFSAVRSG